MTSFNSVAVIGAGAWGTALAGVAARAGRDVVLCARSRERAAEIAATRSNPKLPGVRLDANVEVTGDIARRRARRHHPDRDAGAEFARGGRSARPASRRATPVVACAKGIERGTHKFMTEVIAEAAPRCAAGDPVGAELCRGRGARPADRGDAGGKG